MDLLLWVCGGAAFGFALGWGVFSGKLARTAARNEALEMRLQEQPELLRQEFRNTATSIFEDYTAKFSTHSQKQIGDILNPLRERLGEFQKTIHDNFLVHGKEQHTLKSEIEKIARMNDSLTRALKGDVKAQGNWGEIMLERILEEAGLRRDMDYVVQGTETGASGDRLRPDIIVKLPENRHLIIDSKVSLTAYDRYCAAGDDNARTSHLRDFLKSIKAHVYGLEQKRYQDIGALGTPDFVFMFMPIEGAYLLAMQSDQELQPYAWGKKIIIVPPTTLFANLRTVASMWRIEAQSKNAEEIARQAGGLYDKFVGFIDDLQSIDTQITRLQGTYDQAMNKLKTGTGNLVTRAEKLKQLGARTSKSLPKEVLDDDDKVVPLMQSEEI
jgi:DNA recombination protein RmuC